MRLRPKNEYAEEARKNIEKSGGEVVEFHLKGGDQCRFQVKSIAN